MTEAESLRLDAARCRRLARTVNSLETVALLEEMAREFERRAEKLEAEEKRCDDKSN